MRDITYIIYYGEKLTVEWYHNEQGESQALDYYKDLEPEQRKRFLHLVKRLGDFGKINDQTKFRNEGDQIYTFKPKPDRFFCFFASGGKLVVTNAFCKKQQNLPIEEKKRALRAKTDYELRVKGGVYYE
ncbi:MAG: type II toxin-antitoxin system RelE/ParE family toxin [Candidatus Paracaedibacteraceae bacterium]|nr:type II toxin-antitoxin system RelE/ParE family toxin [Candidatus Paracaedibacteraceae bacterium]